MNTGLYKNNIIILTFSTLFKSKADYKRLDKRRIYEKKKFKKSVFGVVGRHLSGFKSKNIYIVAKFSNFKMFFFFNREAPNLLIIRKIKR